MPKRKIERAKRTTVKKKLAPKNVVAKKKSKRSETPPFAKGGAKSKKSAGVKTVRSKKSVKKRVVRTSDKGAKRSIVALKGESATRSKSKTVVKKKVERSETPPLARGGGKERAKIAATLVGKFPSAWNEKAVSDLFTVAAEVARYRQSGVVSVRVVGDQEMRKLNSLYRGKDKTTDVLSFGYSAIDLALAPGELPELGDIVISHAQAKRQADVIGRAVDAEFALLMVHGFLHVIGYDHVSLKQETEMFALQHEALLKSGWW